MRAILSLFAALSLLAAAPAQDVDYDEFVRLLDQHISLNDLKSLPRTIKANPSHTVGHFQGLVLADIRRGDQGNQETREIVQEAWQEAFDGRTLEHLDRWLQLVASDRSNLRSYEKTKRALNQAYGELQRLKSGQVESRKPYQDLLASMHQIADVLESLGHRIDAAEAWGLIAQIHTSMPERTLDDRRAAVDATEQFLQHRDAWDYTNDSYYQGNKAFVSGEKAAIKAAAEEEGEREAAGYAGDVKGVDAFLMPDADAKEQTAELEFEVMSKQKRDYSMRGNSLPPEWFAVNLTGSGPKPFQWFSRSDIYLVRPDRNEFGVTRDGTETDFSKNQYVEIEASNRLREPTVFHLGSDESSPYAMWFWIGSEQERFQGVQHNLAPVRDKAVVYYKSAASWVAELDDTEITFYDDNANGKLFEEDPFAVGLSDRNISAQRSDEVEVPAFDSIKIGRGEVQPYSSWVEIDGSWYHMRGHDGGTRVGIRPVNPEYFETGTVQLDWTGPRNAEPLFVVIRGEGDFANAVFDIGDGEEHAVPVGKYELAYGRIESGRRRARMMTANIFAGEMEKLEVSADETVTLSLGQPFRLDFVKKGGGGSVTIDPTTFRVRGRSGEVYTHINGAVPEPEVLVSRSDSGRGARPMAEFQQIADAEILNAVSSKLTELGIQVGYYPLPKGSRGEEITVQIEVPEGHFVGLQEKRNKLFGRLEPVWK